MEDRYKLELRERDPSTIQELILDNCKSETIKGIGNDLTSLKHLSMINVGLTSLDGLPLLPELEILDLCENQLDSGLDIVAKQCPKLQKLVLSTNRFSKMEQLDPLKDLKDLNTMDTFQNEVENTEDFRQKLFELIPCLEDLNGQDVNGEMLDEDEELEGAEGEDEGDLSDEEDEEGGPGLSYLESSNIMEDEDETEDYEGVGEEGAESEGAPPTRRGTKRRHEEDSNDGDSKH